MHVHLTKCDTCSYLIFTKIRDFEHFAAILIKIKSSELNMT